MTRPNPSLCASSKFIFKYNFFILAETKSIMHRLEKVRPGTEAIVCHNGHKWIILLKIVIAIYRTIYSLTNVYKLA